MERDGRTLAGGSTDADRQAVVGDSPPDLPTGSVVEPGGGPDRGELFHVLGNDRRRYLLSYLARSDPPVELGTLATHVAARENEIPAEMVDGTQRKRAYTALQQTHLPTLDDAGVVDYDSDRGLVSPTDHTREATVYVEVTPGREFPWREYYLALGAVASALVAGLWIDAPLLSAVSPLTWATLVAVVVICSALLQTLSDSQTRI